jgi:predicted transcriptional regulator
MGLASISFEAPEEFVTTVDEIASNREVDRAEILREALATYVADYEDLKASIEEGERQIEAGETVSHEEVVAWFHAQHPEAEKSEAA